MESGVDYSLEIWSKSHYTDEDDYLALIAADDIVGVEPAFNGATVQVLTSGGGDAHDAAVFDVVVDGVGNHVFLVFGVEIVFIDVFDDAIQEVGRHDILRYVDEIGWSFLGGWFLDDVS